MLNEFIDFLGIIVKMKQFSFNYFNHFDNASSTVPLIIGLEI